MFHLVYFPCQRTTTTSFYQNSPRHTLYAVIINFHLYDNNSMVHLNISSSNENNEPALVLSYLILTELQTMLPVLKIAV